MEGCRGGFVVGFIFLYFCPSPPSGNPLYVFTIILIIVPTSGDLLHMFTIIFIAVPPSGNPLYVFTITRIIVVTMKTGCHGNHFLSVVIGQCAMQP